ncbi:XAP5-domain-containing protein [Eremomyces bilateralis CBS 781.70]|uniref:XAP5-domain-containing protein n=1 Tax=Eremomyces bilateralis CBS 781.70 TaxID=1392243 RepID=A0A6G1G7P3_9PEZI|nr:XAP5-domain-containing protein [Eremomyces bilateralis CBS 781.70]KAF1814115.1 XAP5-domain-containing protein [Eremomyces bilateralis CBS 781.70]
MAPPSSSSGPPSRTSTPTTTAPPRFTAQNATAEDLLKSQTVGLVHLSDFRKRRAEALEQRDRETQHPALGRGSPASGASTPDGAATPQPAKKKRRNPRKGKLSFAVDEDEEDESATSDVVKSRSHTPGDGRSTVETTGADSDGTPTLKKRIGPNTTVLAPRAMTKGALLREAQTREQLRKEFLVMQEAVKATEVAIPFVFYDGTSVPGGVCTVKKGEHIWLFLDKARKVGAELGVGGDKGRREWARVGVDDLMLVRNEMIVPHHYEFYYFIVNKTAGFHGPIFEYSAQPTAATPTTTDSPTEDLTNYDPMVRPEKKAKPSTNLEGLEGKDDDPTITKVVDRRWYERNKHIYPANIWEEFDPTKDYSNSVRKDAEGNSFFFS